MTHVAVFMKRGILRIEIRSYEQVLSDLRLFRCGHCSEVHNDITIYHNAFGQHVHVRDDPAVYSQIRSVIGRKGC